MRALIQRVLEAKVVVEGQTSGEIQHGLLVFLGLGKADNLATGQKLIDKILKYRVFDDENGKMGWNVSQAKGGILLVSQFTLMAQTQKGLRPDFGPPCLLTKQKPYMSNWLNMLSSNLNMYKRVFLPQI